MDCLKINNCEDQDPYLNDIIRMMFRNSGRNYCLVGKFSWFQIVGEPVFLELWILLMQSSHQVYLDFLEPFSRRFINNTFSHKKIEILYSYSCWLDLSSIFLGINLIQIAKRMKFIQRWQKKIYIIKELGTGFISKNKFELFPSKTVKF